MTYTIRLSKRAITDLEDIRAFIARESPAHALLYAAELRDRIVSLTHMPRRCPSAPEGRLRGVYNQWNNCSYPSRYPWCACKRFGR